MATKADKSEHHFPLTDWLKAIPGVFGIRLEEEPEFEVLDKWADVEVRKYGPIVLVETQKSGTREEAIDAAFEGLYKYLQEGNEANRTIEMTTPVLHARSGDGHWLVALCLPSRFSQETAPQPRDPEVRLVTQGPRVVAVKRFAGVPSDESYGQQEQELLDGLNEHGYGVLSKPVYAQYDQPFSVPFLRRNEVQVEVVNAH